MKKCGIFTLFAVCCLLFASQALAGLSPAQKLGELLYFDKHLSLYQNQSCASCHHPSAGYADPLNAALPEDNPVSLGSDETLNGGRNAPTSSYAAFIPVFELDTIDGYIGGQFWDGRADTLKDQAKGPFLNSVEMAMADDAAVIAAMIDPNNKRADDYLKLFNQVYNIDLLTAEASVAYDKVAEAIGEFEQTFEFVPFTSKYDYFLAGKANLSTNEMDGLAVFDSACASCHPSQAEITNNGKIIPPLFTKFTYENIGVPANGHEMFDEYPTDNGLGGRTDPDGEILFPNENGKFRISSLRNIERTAPYSHNGLFATLDAMVNFLNTRDVPEADWAAPEVAKNVMIAEPGELGDLGLSPQDETDLVAFLKTLNDGYGNQTPSNFVLPVMTPLN